MHGSTDSLGSSGGRSAYAQPEPAYAAAAPSATAAAPRPYLPGDAAASGYGPGPGGYPYGAPGGGSTYEGNYDGGPGAGGAPPPRRAPPVTASGHEEDDGYNAYVFFKIFLLRAVAWVAKTRPRRFLICPVV